MLFWKKNKKNEIVSNETIPIAKEEKPPDETEKPEEPEVPVEPEAPEEKSQPHKKTSLDQQIFDGKTKQEKPYFSDYLFGIPSQSIIDSSTVPKKSTPIFSEKEIKNIPPPTTLPPKKTRKKLNRNTELKARFTNEEIKIIEDKINKSGLRKGEFIRRSLLEQEIKERINTKEQIQSTEALIELKSEIGKVGGLLKAFIKPNYNHNVSYEEMQEIKKQLNELEKLKLKIEKEVKKTWQS